MTALHSWDLSPIEAIRIQKQLEPWIRMDVSLGKPRLIAGVDVGYSSKFGFSVAMVVILEFPSLQLLESAVAMTPTSFLYIPGLLSFRELPSILKDINQLSFIHELILADEHGRAHPGRFGIAYYLGLWLHSQTIGIGKNCLCGKSVNPETIKGASYPLRYGPEILEMTLRTRNRVQPVFVSVGYGLA